VNKKKFREKRIYLHIESRRHDDILSPVQEQWLNLFKNQQYKTK